MKDLEGNMSEEKKSLADLNLVKVILVYTDQDGNMRIQVSIVTPGTRECVLAQLDEGQIG
jgi:hypothetical protein